MAVEMNYKSLDRVGVELVSQIAGVQRCKTCRYVWQPKSARDDGKLPAGWWKCPNDPKHTKDPDDK